MTAPDAYTALCDHRPMGLLDRLLGRRDRAAQERLARASAAVDRELAANLELAAMFDQTRQAAVFENSEWARHRETIARHAPLAYRALSDVYERIPETESAMERRGPALSLRPEDRAVVETWEGDARVAQRALREGASVPPPALLSMLLRRFRRP